MTDTTAEILPLLKTHHLPGLDLDANFIHPDYLGGSILNLPSSICHWLGARSFGASPLRIELLFPDSADLRRVILVLVDALALHRLQRWMTDGTAPVWSR